MYAWIAIVACLLLADPPTHELTLASGETLRGVLVEQTDERVVFDHPSLGRLELSAGAVKGVVELAQTPPPVPVQKPLAVQEPPAVQPPPAPPPPPRWKSRFDIGFTGSAGTSEEATVRIGFRSQYRDPDVHYRFDASYLWDTSRGDRTDHNFTTGILADWTIAQSKWSWFASGRYDFDEFQSWEHRFSAHGGLGYFLVNKDNPDGTDRYDLKLRGGLGGRKEIGSDDEDLQPEGLFGFDVTWHVSPSQSFQGSSVAYPDLEKLGELRVITKAEYSIKLDAIEGMTLNTGIDWEWESEVDPGISPNDFNVYVTLGVEF